jgi:O-succinylbenzoic acid--CoA ligase
LSFSILDAAREHPDRLALLDRGLPITYAALAEDVRQLLPLWSGASSPVAFVAEPTRAAVALLLTLVEAGVPAVPLHPRWSETERAKVLKETGAIMAPPSERRVGTAAHHDDERPLAMLRTSGSSGRPKLAVLSHRAFAAAADASSERLGWREDDRWLLALPFAHVGGLSVLLRCLRARRTVVLDDATPERMTATSVTLASFVPTQLARLVQVRQAPPPALRVALIGGGPTTPTLVRTARELGWPVRLTYGLTESCAQAATWREQESGNDHCGPPLAGMELRVNAGVIEVRGPTLLSGYFLDGQVQRATDAEGWFRTGDLGRLDPQGRISVLGRADDVIITGGEKVAPVPVEVAVAAAAVVNEVCVFGVDDPEWGQRVAVVVESILPWERVATAIMEGTPMLSRYERPRLLAVLDSLPRNANGKLDRAALRQQLGDQLRPLPWSN